jgi:hypothetical protein
MFDFNENETLVEFSINHSKVCIKSSIINLPAPINNF